MGDESKVAAYKRLTLDLLRGSGQWMTYTDIYWEHYEADGEVDEPALRVAIGELVAANKIEWDDRHWEFAYRIASPQEGEGLADKPKRLKTERDADLAAAQELIDALPRCEVFAGCVNPATRDYDAIGVRLLCCDEHDPPMDDPSYRKYLAPTGVGGAIRAMLDRIKAREAER